MPSPGVVQREMEATEKCDCCDGECGKDADFVAWQCAVDDPLHYDPLEPACYRIEWPACVGKVTIGERSLSKVFFEHPEAILEKTLSNKPTNPKDIIGTDKCPLHLIPTTADPEVALAFLEGALKYGSHNWREAGVRASIYKSAIGRHLAKWWEGEDRDPETGVMHLASVIASLKILIDSQLAEKLTDDRPIPCGEELRARKALDETEARVKHLRQKFGDRNPKHHIRTGLDNPS